MTNQAFDILAYSQSPKTTKRTTFQDELEAALNVRARKTTLLYSGDLDEDGDDFLGNLLKSRRNRSDAFKASKTKSQMNDFDFSDDDEKQGMKNRTSFLKSLKRLSVEGDPIAPQHEHETLNSCQLSSEDDIRHKKDAVKLASHCPPRDNSSTSLLETTRVLSQSDDVPLDLPFPFHSSTSPAPIRPESRADINGNTGCEESFRTSLDTDLKCVATTGIERETPKPKPRQRTLGLKIHVTEKTETSPPAPITDISTPEKITTRSCSPHVYEIEGTTKQCSSPSLKTTTGKMIDGRCAESCASNSFTLGDAKEQQREDSTSVKESNQESGEHDVAQVTPVPNKSDIRAPSSQSQRRNTARTKKVESKYLGSLKILDCKVSPNCQPQAVDSLRATVYQEWLRKKKEKSSENLNKERILQEQNKQREEEKKKGAANSYEAWKEKKDEMLKAKTKEDKHRLREEQKAVEEVQEKRKAAEQVFHQWKREHDDVLREKCRQQRATEKKLALKKHEEEEERKTASKSAFSDWCEKKTDALYKKVTIERQENMNKAEENRYIQEEKDKMAVEMFEQWLAKKEIQQKRQREEKRLQVILQDSPPPPWSPPNKTIQFRK